jgi:hypothetical protein
MEQTRIPAINVLIVGAEEGKMDKKFKSKYNM